MVIPGTYLAYVDLYVVNGSGGQERLAQEGAIEAGNSFWAARPVAQ